MRTRAKAITEKLRKRAEVNKNDKSVRDLVLLLFKTALLRASPRVPLEIPYLKRWRLRGH